MSPAAELGDDEVVALVRDGYDAVAEQYEALVAMSRPHPRHAWLQRLIGQLRPSSHVLELGCGPGIPTAASIVAAGHHLTGVDIAPQQIARARAHVPSAAFIVANVLDVEFEAHSFDAAVAFYSFVHIPRRHYEALFGRIREWLVHGGLFLATFGTSDSGSSSFSGQ